MKLFRLITLLSFTVVISSCGNQPDNALPSNKDNEKMGKRVDELSKEVSAVSANDRYQEQGAKLTHKTVADTNLYLNKLHGNINSTRVNHLPEWEEMYEALTNEVAIDDPEYGLGLKKRQTNFYRLKLASTENKTEINTLDKRAQANAAANIQQQTTIQLLMERLGTIDRNIGDLNKAVDAKFKSVDKKLADYSGRIEGVENRMKTVEISLDDFRSEFVAYRQRVKNIENLLRRYNLAIMHSDIKDLKSIADNHEERLLDLDGRVKINSSEIADNRNNLGEAEMELSSVSSDIGNIKVAIEDIYEKIGE